MHAEPLDLFKLVLVGQRLISIHFGIDKSPRPKMNGCFGQVALFKQCRARKLLITPPGGHLKSGMTQCLILCLYLLYVYIPCSSSALHHSRPIIFPIKWSKIDCQLGLSDNGVRLIISKHHISNNIAQCMPHILSCWLWQAWSTTRTYSLMFLDSRFTWCVHWGAIF